MAVRNSINISKKVSFAIRQLTSPAGNGRVFGSLPLIYSQPSLRFLTTGSTEEEFITTKPGIKAKIIDGKKVARSVRKDVKKEVEELVARGYRPPHLAAVLVGDDPASQTYVGKKTQEAHRCGITTDTILKSGSISEEELLEVVQSLNEDEKVDGILVQLPLPKHIVEKTVCNSVAPEKDVDGLHILNMGRYCGGEPSFIPCTPQGVLEMLKRCNIQTSGKIAAIIGRSKTVGFPLAALLQSRGSGDATTIVCHSKTPLDKLPVLTCMADIVIAAIGVAGYLKADMVKEGAVVIDVGITRTQLPSGSTKLVGDVDYESVAQVASYITPVPGGVGPMTVAMLMKNTLLAAQRKCPE